MRSLATGRHRGDGFSMIELLVTIVLAGIVLGAMVPFFANALKRTSADELRVDATNIAQDRIEQVRLLSYGDIRNDYLNSPPSPASSFGDGRFGPTYQLIGESRPYHVDYIVSPANDDQAAQKHVTVTVTRSGSTFSTVADAVIMNPEAGQVAATTSASPSALPTTNLSITVSFKNWSQVTSAGVSVQRVQTNVTPFATTTPAPLTQVPTASSTTVIWTGLTGGRDYIYTVTCHSTYITSTCPAFHLLKSARLKFDTHPGGS
jgi:prepilin-type N-terminal cleavage/methylation domain-containing protein